MGLGAAAFTSMLQSESSATESFGLNHGLADMPHRPAKVRRVIFLCMAGGPSHLETFDFKPKLAAMDGQPMPSSFTDGQPIAQLQGQQL